MRPPAATVLSSNSTALPKRKSKPGSRIGLTLSGVGRVFAMYALQVGSEKPPSACSITCEVLSRAPFETAGLS
jgi:hypothetical protein